ncbi:outer membrane protein assembly factor BamC [Agarilytica rhodophyticola]|uniref:outer membrane protein assembly factor BamC n=1 Tax=Agarilytica rhodophyticola TaxID=1737490 RepID=UPI001319CC8A|nr:outer membrane protein assembly factor BamC [Agarilytica rhodophyticola]
MLTFSGCTALYGDKGIFRGKSKDYLEAGAIRPMVVPKGMNNRPLVELYEIPNVSPRDEFGDLIGLEEYEVPRPVAINTEKGKVGVKLQKLGEHKWIFLNASTSQVWPRTQNFFSQFGIQVLVSNPAIGLIETGDVAFKDDDATKSRFRVFIEKGVHPETTEVHILQIERPADQVANTDITWPEISHNVKRERQLLDELANTLATNVNNNSASLLGQNVGGSLKVEFLKDKREPTMRLRLFEERARATVAHALERDGFVLWDESVDKGLYYVGFDPDADKQGMFSRWFKGGLPKTAPHPINTLVQHLAADEEVQNKFAEVDGVAYGEQLPKSIGFLVMVDSSGKTTDVVVRNARGQRIAPARAKELLRIIRKNLI